MELAIVALSLTTLVEAGIIAVLASAIPYLWRRLAKAEDGLEKLDEVVSEFLEAATGTEGKR